MPRRRAGDWNVPLVFGGVFLLGLAIAGLTKLSVPWWGVALAVFGALLIIAGVVVAVVYITARRNLKHRYPMRDKIAGAWRNDWAYLHYDHWLCRLLGGAWGFCGGRHIWFLYGPPIPERAGKPVTQRWQARHEFRHRWRWLTESDLWMAASSFVQHVLRKWRNVSWEADANRHQNETAMATYAEFPGDWLRRLFTDNYGDPDDPSTERRAPKAA